MSAEADIINKTNAPFSFLRLNEPVSTLGNVNFSPDQFLGPGAFVGSAAQGIGSDLARLGTSGFFDRRAPSGSFADPGFNPVGGSGGINTRPINNPALLLPSDVGVGGGSPDFSRFNVGTGVTSPQSGSFFNN